MYVCHQVCVRACMTFQGLMYFDCMNVCIEVAATKVVIGCAFRLFPVASQVGSLGGLCSGLS